MMRDAGGRLLLVLVDGLGYGDIEAGRAPFLRSELAAGLVKPLRPALGYSDAQRAVLLTGKAPDEIGYWMMYRFSEPGQSPWKWLSRMSAVDRAGSRLPARLLKLGMSQTIMRAQARASGRPELAIHNIPFRALKWMRPSDEPPVYAGKPLAGTPTLLSMAAEQGAPWQVLRSDSFQALLRKSSVDAWLPGALRQIGGMDAGVRILFVYIHHPDLFSHRFGRGSDVTAREEGRVDSAVKAVIEAARAKLGPALETIVVSDHGMSDTRRFVDYSDLVMRPDFGKTFVAALDSTMVRAMYLDERGKSVVRDRLAGEDGHFITPEERKEHGIDFPSDWYGEDLFLVNDGVSIYPNYHSLMRPLSMHAYDPRLDSQTAFIYATGGTVEQALRQEGLGMRDVMPWAVRAAGLETTHGNGS